MWGERQAGRQPENRSTHQTCLTSPTDTRSSRPYARLSLACSLGFLTRLRAIIADFRSGSRGGLCWVGMAGSSPQRSISLKTRCGSLGSAGIWARLRCTFRTTHQSRALVRLGTAPSPMSTRPLQLQYAALHVFGSEHPLLDLRAFQLSFTCPLNQFGSQA